MNKPTYVPYLSSIYTDLHKQDVKMVLHVESNSEKYFVLKNFEYLNESVFRVINQYNVITYDS